MTMNILTSKQIFLTQLFIIAVLSSIASGSAIPEGECQHFHLGGDSGVHFYTCCNYPNTECTDVEFDGASDGNYCDEGQSTEDGDGTELGDSFVCGDSCDKVTECKDFCDAELFQFPGFAGIGLCALMHVARIPMAPKMESMVFSSRSPLTGVPRTFSIGGLMSHLMYVVSVQLTMSQKFLTSNVQIIVGTEFVVLVNALQIVRKIAHPLRLHPLHSQLPVVQLTQQDLQRLPLQYHLQYHLLEEVEVSMKCNVIVYKA